MTDLEGKIIARLETLDTAVLRAVLKKLAREGTVGQVDAIARALKVSTLDDLLPAPKQYHLEAKWTMRPRAVHLQIVDQHGTCWQDRELFRADFATQAEFQRAVRLWCHEHAKAWHCDDRPEVQL